MEIIRGTTPTMQFTFTEIDPTEIAAAYLCIAQLQKTVIERDLSSGTISDGKLCFTLSQEETLALKKGCEAAVTLDWKTSDGTRGRSERVLCKVGNSGKDVVI